MTVTSTGQALSILLYVIATIMLWRRLQLLQLENNIPGLRAPAGLVIFAGVIAHFIALYIDVFSPDKLQVGITAASSLVAAIIITLFLVAYTRKPIENLGLILLPVAALAVLLHWIWPGAQISVNATPLATLHIAVSLLAYGLLAIAAAQGILLLLQERLLRQHQPGGILRALPPLQSVESLMFQLITIGFVLLSLTLISGIFFSEEVFGKGFRFNHHIVLSISGWAVFGALLIGRWRSGWRGTVAAAWTLTGFGLVLLAYFGTKLVAEVILQKSV